VKLKINLSIPSELLEVELTLNVVRLSDDKYEVKISDFSDTTPAEKVGVDSDLIDQTY